MSMLKKTLNNRYQIKSQLGRGGTAETFLATDKQTKHQVVCKLLRVDLLSDWKSLELFAREADTLKTLDHPLIPDYVDHFQAEIDNQKNYVLVQEYIAGPTLDSQIREGKRFSLGEVRGILTTMLETLDYIHRLHPAIIHRDINPKNIILGKDGKPYLVDFGAVGNLRQDTQSASRSDTFVGTIGYMPQEQLYGKTLPASDLYSLGMTIVFMATGVDPAELDFDGARLDFRSHTDLPDDITLLLEKMTEPDFRKRPQSARGALDFLEGKVKVPKFKPKPGRGRKQRIKIEVECDTTTIKLKNTAVGSTMLMGLGLSMLGLMAFSGFMQFCEILETGDGGTFGTFLVEGFPFLLSGVVPVLYKIFFKTRRKLVLARGKIILHTTWLFLLYRRLEVDVADYEGFEDFPNWSINKVQAYKCKIHLKRKRYLLGHNYYADETALLQKTIEGYIAKNLIR